MRHSSWLRLEASPFWYSVYRNYRRLPDGIRAPIRVLFTPQWQLAAAAVRTVSRRRIVAGPFQGIRMELSGLSSRHLLCYLLGSAEIELRDVIGRVIDRGYRTILNIGAADGYYAVGLAVRSPGTQVEAFEALPAFHAIVERSARANGVQGRIALRGACDANALRHHLQTDAKPSLVLMDIEGGEAELLDPLAVPQLRQVDILVETHDAFVPRITETLIDRFQATHHIERYTARSRLLNDFPPDFLPTLKRWFPRLVVELMDERRTGLQHWLFLTAKGGDAGTARP
jgi:predicted O-methyltransferase YrrM